MSDRTDVSILGRVSIQKSQKPRNPRRAVSISSSGALSENHEIPPIPPSSCIPSHSVMFHPTSPFCRADRSVRTDDDYFASALARSRDNGPSKYLFFGPALLVRPNGRTERAPLNLVWRWQWAATKRQLLTPELRGAHGRSWKRVASCRSARFLVLLFRRMSEGEGVGRDLIFWFACEARTENRA